MTTRGEVLVTGASVAGPAAAYWLDRIGYRVTVVERAPELRDTGQNIDVRGTGREALARMGLEDAVRAAGTGEVGTRFVDDDGATVSEFPVTPGEGDGPTAELEVLRGELARLLVDACPDTVTWRYGASVTALTQSDDGVDVTFADGSTGRYDLLVVAEGAASRTRALVWDEAAVSLKRLGMYVAYGTVSRTASDDQWWRWLSTSGARSVSLRPDNRGTTRAMLAFMSGPCGLEDGDADGQRAMLRERFGDLGWEVPRILDGIEELYVDDLTQVRCSTWSRGRVVLLGDAAWCVTPVGGGGTSLALAGAYVLAASLSSSGSPAEALAAYEEWLRPLVDDVQDLPPGTPRLANPRTRVGVALFRTATRVAASGPVQAVAGRLTSGPTSHRPLPDLVVENDGRDLATG